MSRLALLIVFTLCASFVCGQGRAYSPLEPDSKAAALSKIIHGDFKSCLISSLQPKPVLLSKEDFVFSGDVEKLNVILEQVSKLPGAFSVTVYLTGPAVPGVEPLSSGAAKTAVDYDWMVQTMNTTQVSIFIPLASRIPFAGIQFPRSLSIEAYPEVTGIVKNFIRIRDVEMSEVIVN